MDKEAGAQWLAVAANAVRYISTVFRPFSGIFDRFPTRLDLVWSAVQGHAKSQARLGWCCSNGEGTAADPQAAVQVSRVFCF